MRKTRPITLPDDANAMQIRSSHFNPTPDLSEHNTSLENITIDCELINMDAPVDSSATSDRHPLVTSIESTDLSQVPSSQQQLLLSSSQTDELSESDTNERNEILAAVGNSLENEYLNALTAGCASSNSEPVIMSTTSTNNNNNLQVRLPEDESDEYSARPRQLGRRSEARARIVSITTETDSLGDQRIIVNRDSGENSADVSNEPHASPHYHSSRMSEPSSIATSRNTSPISIESSSASSSSVASSNNER